MAPATTPASPDGSISRMFPEPIYSSSPPLPPPIPDCCFLPWAFHQWLSTWFSPSARVSLSPLKSSVLVFDTDTANFLPHRIVVGITWNSARQPARYRGSTDVDSQDLLLLCICTSPEFGLPVFDFFQLTSTVRHNLQSKISSYEWN